MSFQSQIESAKSSLAHIYYLTNNPKVPKKVVKVDTIVPDSHKIVKFRRSVEALPDFVRWL